MTDLQTKAEAAITAVDKLGRELERKTRTIVGVSAKLDELRHTTAMVAVIQLKLEYIAEVIDEMEET